MFFFAMQTTSKLPLVNMFGISSSTVMGIKIRALREKVLLNLIVNVCDDNCSHNKKTFYISELSYNLPPKTFTSGVR